MLGYLPAKYPPENPLKQVAYTREVQGKPCVVMENIQGVYGCYIGGVQGLRALQLAYKYGVQG